MALYDAFVSYSHAKDKPIAAALQRAVQTLGKPWYQRRALRVFRDDTSLSATPHLWPTIEQALGESRYLILLASPEAASSPWVNKEIAYWLEAKNADTLLIAVTDGALTWDNAANDFAWDKSPPLPPALKGKFAAEPKWVDLTAYREAADKRDAKFTELAADFAAAIRGMPKEDLLSQEVKQQRRALRLALGAAASLLILAGLAAWQWKTAVDSERAATEQKKIAQQQRDRAEKTLAAATQTANTLVLDLAQEFRTRQGMPTDLVRKILDRAQELQKQLTESGEASPDLRDSEVSALHQLVRTLLDQGDTQAALAAAERSRSIAEGLVAADPGNKRYRRSLAISYGVLGKALEPIGRREEALDAFRRSEAIFERLAAANPEDFEPRRDLALIYNEIADILLRQGRREEALETYYKRLAVAEKVSAAAPQDLRWQKLVSSSYGAIGKLLGMAGRGEEALDAYRKAVVIAEKAVAADPGSSEWPENLAFMYSSLAGALAASGHRNEALATLDKGLAIFEKLAAADTSHTFWQRDVADVHNRIGHELMDSGRRQEALEAYRKGLAVFEKLAASDPGNAEWQRDLAISFDNVANTLRAMGQSEQALAAYRRSFTIFEKLAAAEPGNTQAQSDLASSYGALARVLRDPEEAIAAARKSATIRDNLAAADPGNAEWQNDLSAAYSRIAFLLLNLGRLEEALVELRKSLAPAEKLVAADPSNADWQKGLSINYNQVGDVLKKQERFDDALVEYRKALAIREKLVAAEPGNIEWQENLAASLDRVAIALVGAGRRAEALDGFRKSLAVREKVAASDPSDTGWQIELAKVLYNLALDGDEAVARLERASSIMRTVVGTGKLGPTEQNLLNEIEASRASKLAERGRAALYADQFAAAADDMLAALRVDPVGAYWVIWLHVVRTRAGQNDSEEFAANGAKVDHAKWPWPVVALFLGSSNPRAVRTAALAAADETERDGQACEADFYVGIYQVQNGAQADGRQLIEAAAAKCPKEFIEYEAARRELKRLDGLATLPAKQ